LQLVTPGKSREWQSIIGMSNAIVHDYLNLDVKVSRTIVVNKMYVGLQNFAFILSDKLKAEI
jgi:uncharacterized protein with HEPN domain